MAIAGRARTLCSCLDLQWVADMCAVHGDSTIPNKLLHVLFLLHIIHADGKISSATFSWGSVRTSTYVIVTIPRVRTDLHLSCPRVRISRMVQAQHGLDIDVPSRIYLSILTLLSTSVFGLTLLNFVDIAYLLAYPSLGQPAIPLVQSPSTPAPSLSQPPADSGNAPSFPQTQSASPPLRFYTYYPSSLHIPAAWHGLECPARIPSRGLLQMLPRLYAEGRQASGGAGNMGNGLRKSVLPHLGGGSCRLIV